MEQQTGSQSFFLLTVMALVEDLMQRSEVGILPFSQYAPQEGVEPVWYDDSEMYVETEDIQLYPVVTGYEIDEDGTPRITGKFEPGNLDLMIRAAVAKTEDGSAQIWIDDPYTQRGYFLYIQNGELKVA